MITGAAKVDILRRGDPVQQIKEDLSDPTCVYIGLTPRMFTLEGEGKWQISIDGADWLVDWRQDGGELYYLDLEGDLHAVGVTLGDDLVAGIPRELFPTRADRSWEVSGNGVEFIIGTPIDETSDLTTTLIINWLASD